MSAYEIIDLVLKAALATCAWFVYRKIDTNDIGTG